MHNLVIAIKLVPVDHNVVPKVFFLKKNLI